uniref:Probable RNA polymerase II nuclear localization protein SLC7A6OS n=1 Tax=Leptobrachium leishanense TaxID=445787 RepID=A0A8C5WGJ8_9ANUR
MQVRAQQPVTGACFTMLSNRRPPSYQHAPRRTATPIMQRDCNCATMVRDVIIPSRQSSVVTMEAAVLRVKRKRGAEPAEALVISCKRLRAEEQAVEPREDVTTAVFRLAATVTSQNEPLQKYISDALSRDRAAQALRPSMGSMERIQQGQRTRKGVERQNSRYRVVSSLRPAIKELEVTSKDSDQPASLDSDGIHTQSNADASGCETGDTVTNSHFQLFDMVQEESETPAEDLKEADPEAILCNAVKMIRERLTVSKQSQGSELRENADEFVYDIYYAESSPTDWIQDILYVQPYTQEQELVPDDLEPEETYEDEDDENDEGNWRNDYPDEDNSDPEERYQGYYEENDGDDAWTSYCNKNHSFLGEEEDDDD